MKKIMIGMLVMTLLLASFVAAECDLKSTMAVGESGVFSLSNVKYEIKNLIVKEPVMKIVPGTEFAKFKVNGETTALIVQ